MPGIPGVGGGGGAIAKNKLYTAANLAEIGISPTAIYYLADLTDELGSYNLTQAAGAIFPAQNPCVAGAKWSIGSNDNRLENNDAIFRHNGALSVTFTMMLDQFPVGTTQGIVGCCNALGPVGAFADAWSIKYETGTNQLVYSHADAGTEEPFQDVGLFPRQQVFHVIMTRSLNGQTVTFYIFGVQVAQFTGLITPLGGANSILRIFSCNVAIDGFSGYLGNMVIDIGNEWTPQQVADIKNIAFPLM